MPPRSLLPVSLLLLTLATGAVNAIAFLALGGVFSSVMTANLGLIGLSAASRDAMLAMQSALALAGFAVGVPIGSRFTAAGFRWAGARGALAAELVILCGVLAGWAALGGEPHGGARHALLAASAMAMGCQSGTVQVTGPAGMSTTFVTGSLTQVIGDVATGTFRAGQALLILMLPLGALLGGLAVIHARQAAPAVPAAFVAAALASTWRT
ncbi:DUF1275 family protein [Streptomyces sp. NBC_01190]|uniref:DUF1275 family protein n=1 Tax=Streptomyces sp. NBC_01190 TaxID=2903767 RepID=UPI0038630A2F|nr:DUF1275 family protein [Streptomyces sp. NBC_01190]